MVINRYSRQQAGDTLIEVTIAISILTIVLASSSQIAIRAFQLAQTARERSTASYAAQYQIEHLRALRENHTWAEFMAYVSSGTGTGCKVTSPCFHMELNPSLGKYLPAASNKEIGIGGAGNSYVEISRHTPLPPAINDNKSYHFIVSYGFRSLSGGKDYTGHIQSQLVSLERGL